MQINFLYYTNTTNAECERRRSKFIAINIAIETVYSILYAIRSLALAPLANVRLAARFYSIRPWWYVKIYDDFNLMLNRMKIQPKIKLKQTSIFSEVYIEMQICIPHLCALQLCETRTVLFLQWIARAVHIALKAVIGDLKYGIKTFLFFFLLFTRSPPCALHSYIWFAYHSFEQCSLFFFRDVTSHGETEYITWCVPLLVHNNSVRIHAQSLGCCWFFFADLNSEANICLVYRIS